MSIRVLGRAVLVLLLVGLVGGVVALVRQWDYRAAGPYAYRVNRLTGQAQIKGAGGAWTAFAVDPYAPALTPAQLAQIEVRDIVWGENGVLLGRAVNPSSQPVAGRLAFRVLLRDANELRKTIRERSLRATVVFPPRSETPLILQTSLPTPDPKQRRTFLTLEPINLGAAE